MSRDTPLKAAQRYVGSCLDDVRTRFRPGVKVSLFVRSPGFPDRDFVMTDDDIAEVLKMIERRRASEPVDSSQEGQP